MFRLIAALALFLFIVNVTIAAEKQIVCAKYRKDYGWSSGYRVEATIIKGVELNKATVTFNYKPISTYVVIFWDKGQASIIELDFPILTGVGQPGEDQKGRKWKISKSSICF
ncbi:conserved hypothetical protein [Nitrosococcus oceani ATCC 19707]|uniref:Uncharacterized protein n=2 Tax=Nitrosococcus oceani TaxID=1229 RepID=Q3J8Z2_NITOC|nr:hypothetical protein [Nitrosococcus oceani]ABA58704.1 conserved hypothetical protein [Nitrosococcus oceani ATCC 19707]KFI18781.1 hypothetical protein IB75_11995 [Nitrosococcus oceani C-27]GEM19204.1 hypothetical protein NONS58_05810 [Nitrosococcus oceani]